MWTAGLSIRVVLALAAMQPVASHAQSADWPARTVNVIVPFAPGGNTDVMARMASSKLATEFGQTFVVENRVGAGGALAAAYVAQAAPDGHTLMFGAAPQIAVVPKIQKVNELLVRGVPADELAVFNRVLSRIQENADAIAAGTRGAPK